MENSPFTASSQVAGTTMILTVRGEATGDLNDVLDYIESDVSGASVRREQDDDVIATLLLDIGSMSGRMTSAVEDAVGSAYGAARIAPQVRGEVTPTRRSSMECPRCGGPSSVSGAACGEC